MEGSSFCFAHRPELAARRRAGQAKGGAARSNARRLKRQYGEPLELAEVDTLLGIALRAVLSGKMETGVANSAATVARAIAAVRQVGELEERLAALEERAGQRGTA